jgi:hypothetical protein
MNPRFLLLCFAICLMVLRPAHAGFTIVNPPAVSKADTQTILPPAVTMPNMADQTAQPVPPGTLTMATTAIPNVVNGFGHDIPLSIAVKQIVPSSVHVNFDNSVDQSMMVTWHGGKSWQEVLADAIRPNSLFISENAPSSIVISAMRPAPAMAAGFGAQTVIPGPVPGYLNNPANSFAPQISTLQPVALPPIEIPTWTAKSSDTLHQALEAWCKRANVTLKWDSEFDYPIETDVSLTGDFETSVRTLLRGLRNANPRPVAHYYRGQSGMPGVLLVPSPGADTGPTRTDSATPVSLPPAALPAISNTNIQ